MKKYADSAEFHRRKDTQRKAEAKLPAAQKMAIVSKLRDVERTLAPVRAANKAKRAAKQVKIRIKTA
jgi:hypothetical protein